MFQEKYPLNDVAYNILKKRYFTGGETTWEELVDRVVNHILSSPVDDEQYFLTRNMMLNRYFIPNSPCLVNSGKKNGGILACFVVDFPDSIEGIYKTKLDFALIAKKGGGCGTTLSKLRPENSTVEGSTHGYAGGPVKFYDTICHDMEAMTQAGFRNMAMMGTYSIYGPDIIKFIKAKEEEGKMSTTNISVVVDDEFMEKVEKDETYTTYFDFPSGRKYYETYKARDIFNLIVDGAWRNGEPGVLYYDAMNDSPYKYSEQEILATNPCIIGDTEIQTVEGLIPIKDLVGKEIEVYTRNSFGELEISWARNIRKTREKAKLVKINTTRKPLICTPDHLILKLNGEYVQAKDLKEGDRLVGLNRKMGNEQQVYISLSGNKKYRSEHRFIASYYWKDLKGKDVHHVDGNHLNNKASNLSILDHSQHSIVTMLGHPDWTNRDSNGKFMKHDSRKPKTTFKLSENPVGVKYKVISVEELDYTEDVYDMEVDFTHNFIANGMVIHNCGEQCLPPNGSCNLGSIDISKFINDENELDLGSLEICVRLVARFLDKVIDKNIYPTKDIEKWAKENRPIGIGIMGLADYYLQKEIPYGSKKALEELELILSFIKAIAEDESIIMGKELGIPLACKVLPIPRRNVTLLSIAPTGTISLLAGCNSGIEPIFSEITIRNDKTGIYHLKNISSDKDYFRCAVSANGAKEVTWKEHIDTQATSQKFVDAAVSKTINFPNHTHRDTIYDSFIYAWKSGCKGLTVYRNGSRKVEVLSPKNLKKDKCPVCGEDLIYESGCKKCSKCDFVVCVAS